MLGSLYNLQDRRSPEKEERPLDWDGSYCYRALDMRGSRWEPQWSGRHSALSSQETPGSRDQMCDTLVSGLRLHWVEGAGYTDILEFVDHHFIYRDYFLWVESRQNTVLCLGSDWQGTEGQWWASQRRDLPRSGELMSLNTLALCCVISLMEAVKLGCLQGKKSSCLGGRVT